MNTKINSIALLFASIILLGCAFLQSLVQESRITPASGECTEFDLTPEECANAGTHEYSTSTQILFDRDGETCLIDDGDVTISITFLTPDTFLYTDSFGNEFELSKRDHNLYEGGYVQPDGDFEWKHILTFTETGFLVEARSYYLEGNEHLCTFLWEQKIIGDR